MARNPWQKNFSLQRWEIFKILLLIPDGQNGINEIFPSTLLMLISSSPAFQALTLDFNWRSAFRGLVPHMEHCIKVVVDDVCTKNLLQEEALHSSGQTSVTLSPITGHSSSGTHLKKDSYYYQYSERETPKMIAKVILNINFIYLFFSFTVMNHSQFLIPI